MKIHESHICSEMVLASDYGVGIHCPVQMVTKSQVTKGAHAWEFQPRLQRVCPGHWWNHLKTSIAGIAFRSKSILAVMSTQLLRGAIYNTQKDDILKISWTVVDCFCQNLVTQPQLEHLVPFEGPESPSVSPSQNVPPVPMGQFAVPPPSAHGLHWWNLAFEGANLLNQSKLSMVVDVVNLKLMTLSIYDTILIATEYQRGAYLNGRKHEPRAEVWAMSPSVKACTVRRVDPCLLWTCTMPSAHSKWQFRVPRKTWRAQAGSWQMWPGLPKCW